MLELRSFYVIGADLVLSSLPNGTARVVAVTAVGETFEAEINAGARIDHLGAGTYCVQALGANDEVLAEEFTTIGRHQGERPVHGFATSFSPEEVWSVLDWHRALRSTVVQIYDWMASYTAPLGSSGQWKDPSNRPVSLKALQALAAGLHESGAVAHAYAPVYAVGNDFASEHPEMLMYNDEGKAIRFLDQIVLANPGNAEWQRHFVASYGEAMDAVGFDGLHVDTYGYPRIAFDAEGTRLDIAEGYTSFLNFLRGERRTDLISFNQVNGVPSAVSLPDGPGFRYCEIWPPNTAWRHFEGLMDRSSGRSGLVGSVEERDPLIRGSIACYPPVWGIDKPSGLVEGVEREDALRTVVLTEAIATSIGSSALLYGDLTAALCDPYYPKHALLSKTEASTVLAWRRFALRCRDLFFEGEDTSWYEIGDENGSVGIESPSPVSPEPLGESVFARVAHGENFIAVSVVDLTGSEKASWMTSTKAGTVSSVTVRVLVDHPGNWRAEGAVLGLGDSRFTDIGARVVPHRQGRALEVQLPLVDGWSVLRLRRAQSIVGQRS
ncbi:MAG: glycoside hydrolase family 66 protein [Acidimicrobiales bacterium]